MARYQVTAPILAVLDEVAGDQRVFVTAGHQRVIATIPVGAVLRDSSEPSTTLLGLVGVYWEDRHYSISFRDLLKKAKVVRSA